MFFSLFALVGLAAALPGSEQSGWGGQPQGPAPCSTKCSTSVCTQSSVTNVPYTNYITKTTCQASTATTKIPYTDVKQVVSTIIKTVVTSYPSTVWVTKSETNQYPTTIYKTEVSTKESQIPTSVCSNTVCPEVTQKPSTVYQATTETICKTKTASWNSGGHQWGYDQDWGNWDWQNPGKKDW